MKTFDKKGTSTVHINLMPGQNTKEYMSKKTKINIQKEINCGLEGCAGCRKYRQEKKGK